MRGGCEAEVLSRKLRELYWTPRKVSDHREQNDPRGENLHVERTGGH